MVVKEEENHLPSVFNEKELIETNHQMRKVGIMAGKDRTII